MKWEQHIEPLPILQKLKKQGWSLVALEITKDAIDISEYEPSDKVCLIVGHELTGVPDDILSLCDDVVFIPMLGKKESLNVAVAAGIALHQIRASGVSS